LTYDKILEGYGIAGDSYRFFKMVTTSLIIFIGNNENFTKSLKVGLSVKAHET